MSASHIILPPVSNTGATTFVPPVETSQLISPKTGRSYTNLDPASPSRPATQPSKKSRAFTKSYDDDFRKNTNSVQLRLLNNGSVARDHLACERTFLSYVRTSLGIAGAGVALMQLLHLGPSTKSFASPIGAVMVVTSLLVLLIGTRRFFLVQRALVTGYYPASFLEMAVISFILGSIIVAIFGIVVAGRIQ